MENSIDGLMEQRHLMKRPIALPWVLFAVALFAGMATSLHLSLRLRAARSDAAAVAARMRQSEEDLRAQVRALRDADVEMEARLQKLERQSWDLVTAKEELELKMKHLAAPAPGGARSRVALAGAVRPKPPPELVRSKRPLRKVAKRQERS